MVVIVSKIIPKTSKSNKNHEKYANLTTNGSALGSVKHCKAILGEHLLVTDTDSHVLTPYKVTNRKSFHKIATNFARIHTKIDCGEMMDDGLSKSMACCSVNLG